MLDVLNLEPPDWTRAPSEEQLGRAFASNEQGRSALDVGDLDGAQRLFEGAIAEVDLVDIFWFNLGLVYKRRRDWPRCAACNRRSLDLGADEHDPAYWNLGIAATALRDWETARYAWRHMDIDIPEGHGPIELDLGPSPLRINPEGAPEVVWGRRIDPARILVLSVPLPASGRRWGDIVLHDGEPQGERRWGEHSFPVFDELEVWQSSTIPTWECVVAGAAEEDLDELHQAFGQEGFGSEDWTHSVRMLCDSCSRGVVDDGHSHEGFDAGAEGNHVGIAAPEEVARRVLAAWAEGRPGRSASGLVAVDL